MAVRIDCFHDVIVSPIAAAQIAELLEPVCVDTDVPLVRTALEHPVDDCRHFRSCDCGIRPERAIRIAGDPAVLRRANHSIVVPVRAGNIPERIRAAKHLIAKAHRNGGELRARNLGVRAECAVRVAVDYTERRQRINCLCIPGISHAASSEAACCGFIERSV